MNKNKSILLGLSICASIALNAEEQTTILEDVSVVSASGFKQNIAEAPASISLITASELEKKSYTDILDAVKDIPGVFVSNSEITMRGMSKEFTLFLVDGRPISTARTMQADSGKTDGQIGVNLPNIDMVERIEVVRGPMSSLYGSEAMGGVINIITKKSTDKLNGSISSEYSIYRKSQRSADKNLSLYLNGPIIKDKLSLSLNGLKQDSYTNEKKKIGGKLSWNINEENNLGFEYSHSDQLTINSENYEDYGFKKDLAALTHEATYEDFIINSYLQSDKTESVNSKNQEEDLLTLNTKGSYFFEEHITTLGAQYKKEKFNDDINQLGSGVDRWLASVFLENEWEMTDDFSLTTGLRYNHDELFKGEITPRIYGVYALNENITFKGGISTGYKQPGITDTSPDYGIIVTQRGVPLGVEVGNPDLQPESSVNYEIGVNYSLANTGLNTSLMIFRTDYKNKFIDTYTCGSKKDKTGSCSYQGTNYNFIREQVNVDDAQIEGLELTFDYKVTPTLKVSTNYSYTKSEQKSGDYKGQALNKLPKHMYNINLDWDTTSTLNTWAQYNYRGKTSEYLTGSTMAESTEGYGYFNLGAAYKISKAFTIKAGIYNVLNKIVDEEDRDTSADVRRITLGLNYKF